MHAWKKVPLWQKGLLVAVVIVISLTGAPELMPLLDLGGMELAIAYLLLTYKPLFHWLTRQREKLTQLRQVGACAWRQAAGYQPRIFALQSAFALLSFWLFGSGVFVWLYFVTSALPS